MKRIFSIFTISLLLSVMSCVGNKTSNPVQPTTSSQDTTETAGNKPEAKEGDKEQTIEEQKEKEGIRDFLPIISLIIAVLGLGTGVKAIFTANQKSKKLESRLHNAISDFESLELRINRLKANLNLLDEKTDRELNDLKGELSKNADYGKQDIISSVEYVNQEHVYRSRTLYGVFKPKYSGVPSEQLSDVKEDNSTVKIVTDSETEAHVSLVDNLGKTQFANLNDTAVEVVDGNPQSYDRITEVESGRMRLEDEVWVLVSKIKVKLS